VFEKVHAGARRLSMMRMVAMSIMVSDACVSDALIGYEKYRGVRERQEQSVKDLQESVNMSLMRYKGGPATYLSVLDSQRSRSTAELTLAQARNNEYQSLIQLYMALGGGWK
jgi:multidrug efflux system outer membrane protein